MRLAVPQKPNGGVNFIMDMRQFRVCFAISVRAVIIILRFHVQYTDMRSNSFEII